MPGDGGKSIYADESFDDTDLTSHMEDYIEMIAILSESNRVVRVKDIARSLGFKMPSVSAALLKLREKGLINYEKYGYIELTGEGKRAAAKVYRRHSFLSDFFHTVLRMDRGKAGEEACRVEHHLSPEACRRINRFMEYHRSQSGTRGGWTEDLRGILEEQSLSELREGEEAVITRIAGNGPFRKRLQEMGFRRGEKLRVVKYAPLRDPLQVELKGYALSLRVDEAKSIRVRPVPREESHEG